MKKLQLLLLLLFFVNTLFAQEYTKIDTVLKEFYYDYNYQPDSTNIDLQKSQAMVLQIGKKYSKFISVVRIGRDSLLGNANGMSAKNFFAKYGKHPSIVGTTYIFCSYQLFKDYNHKGDYELWGNVGSNFHAMEKGKLHFDWKLDASQDTTILSYKCHKATCHFAGRDYVAWYTPDIPISNGPYKFTGLPGLILSVADTKKQHSFHIYKIKDKVKRNIFFYGRKSRFKMLTTQEYVRGLNLEFKAIAKMYGGYNSKIQFKSEAQRAKFSHKLRSKNNYIEQYPK